jgi:Protein of unknown function (DUF2846)
MKRILALLAIAACATLLPGCASGPKFGEVKSSFPPLAQENGRIYFYRTTVLGAGVQPAVKLNGEKIGTAKPQGFFYADRRAGNYEVETSTEVKRRLSLTLDNSQIRYVRLNMAMGFFVGHVYPELVDDQTGEKEICGCKYTGGK